MQENTFKWEVAHYTSEEFYQSALNDFIMRENQMIKWSFAIPILIEAISWNDEGKPVFLLHKKCIWFS
jgi:hypothetical protein